MSNGGFSRARFAEPKLCRGPQVEHQMARVRRRCDPTRPAERARGQAHLHRAPAAQLAALPSSAHSVAVEQDRVAAQRRRPRSGELANSQPTALSGMTVCGISSWVSWSAVMRDPSPLGAAVGHPHMDVPAGLDQRLDAGRGHADHSACQRSSCRRARAHRSGHRPTAPTRRAPISEHAATGFDRDLVRLCARARRGSRCCPRRRWPARRSGSSSV